MTAERSGARRKPTRRRAAKEGRLLLLVEDQSISRQVLKTQLNLAGFVVDLARDGREGLARFRRKRYALVFTDVNMPEMDGLALARAIRAHEAARHQPRTPVLALSMDVSGEEQRAGRDAGLDDFLVKPPTAAQLEAKLRQWLPALAGGDAGAAPDAETLRKLTRGDAAAMKQVLAEFKAAIEEDLRRLDVALGKRDAGAVAREGHRIKGASRLVGAARLEQVADELERAGKASDWNAIAAASAALHKLVTDTHYGK